MTRKGGDGSEGALCGERSCDSARQMIQYPMDLASQKRKPSNVHAFCCRSGTPHEPCRKLDDRSLVTGMLNRRTLECDGKRIGLKV